MRRYHIDAEHRPHNTAARRWVIRYRQGSGRRLAVAYAGPNVGAARDRMAEIIEAGGVIHPPREGGIKK